MKTIPQPIDLPPFSPDTGRVGQASTKPNRGDPPYGNRTDGARALADELSPVMRREPVELIVAVPVASRQLVEWLDEFSNRVVCPATPEVCHEIGAFYREGSPVNDEEVEARPRAAWWEVAAEEQLV